MLITPSNTLERETDRQRDANNPFKHVGERDRQTDREMLITPSNTLASSHFVSDLMTMGGAVSVLATQ